MTKAFIGVCRVSTQEQGQNKNGLEAQRAEIERWAKHHGYNLIAIMDEVISGSTPLRNRPVMSAALSLARKMKAKVVVTKTDRCSRDFDIARLLMQKRKDVIAIDLGEDADGFVEIIFSGLAEKERKMIGMRTKAGLAAAKARGVILGNRTNLEDAQALGQEMQRKRADAFANDMKVTIQAFHASGMNAKQIAAELNDRGIRTARDKSWHSSTVRNIMVRW